VISWPQLAGIALVTLLLGGMFAALARRLGWLGRGWSGAEKEGGLHAPRVPPIGGLTILLVLIGVEFADLGMGPLPWAALGGAWVLGTWDDFRPLAALPKVIGQLVVGLLFALQRGSLQSGNLLVLGQDLALAVVAQNLANTFDHSNGLCAGWALLLPGTPWALRGALLGFLPLNLLGRRSTENSVSQPRAYLGDAGSHLLGILVASQPGAWLALALPALDLTRVVVLRWREGQPFWRADRRHLGHRLEARSWPPIAALLILWPLWFLAGWPWVLGGIGLGFGLLLWFTASSGCTRAAGRR